MSEAYTCNRCEQLFKGNSNLAFTIAIKWDNPQRIDLCEDCAIIVKKEYHIK